MQPQLDAVNLYSTSCLQAQTVSRHGYRHYFLIGNGALYHKLTHYSNLLFTLTELQCLTDFKTAVLLFLQQKNAVEISEKV